MTAAEFKEIAWSITWEKWADEAAKQQDVKTLMGRILTNACAAINARCNMTIYLGIQDDGTIRGILIESLDLVHTLNQILDEYLREPQLKAFRAKGKLKFSPKMRTAFSQCVGKIIAIPVDGAPPTAKGSYYVLEIDICPRYIFTEDMTFYFCNSEGKVISYIRNRASNIQSTDPSFKLNNATPFEDMVEQSSKWRKDEDLQEQLVNLQKEQRLLKENNTAINKRVQEKLHDMIEVIKTQLENQRDLTPSELERVLTLDPISAAKKEAWDAPSRRDKMRSWGVQAVLDLTKAPFRTLKGDDLRSIATLSKRNIKR